MVLGAPINFVSRVSAAAGTKALPILGDHHVNSPVLSFPDPSKLLSTPAPFKHMSDNNTAVGRGNARTTKTMRDLAARF